MDLVDPGFNLQYQCIDLQKY